MYMCTLYLLYDQAVKFFYDRAGTVLNEVSRGESTDSYFKGAMNVAYFLHLQSAKSLYLRVPPCNGFWLYKQRYSVDHIWQHGP